MAEKKQVLTPEEINQQRGEELPGREEGSLIQTKIATPIGTAAAHGHSDDSPAKADVMRVAPIPQAR